MADDNRVHVFMNTFRLDEDQAKYVLEQTYKTIKSLNEPPTEDKEPSREAIMKLLKDRYKLNDIQSTNILEYAYSLSKQRDMANDFSLAHYLNERAMAIFRLVVDSRNNSPDTTKINRSYVLIVDTLKRIYSRNPELQKIEDIICWQAFDVVDYIDGQDLWEFGNSVGNDGLLHNSKVNRLCISNGIEKPNIAPDIKKILDEASRNVNVFVDELDPKKEDEDEYEFDIIPAYSLTYKDDGTILVNDVLKLKKLQAGQASDMVLSQSFKHDGQLEPFKPNVATKRQLTTIIGDMGFDKTLRTIFFPTISKDKGIVFRSRLTRAEADEQHINTKQLDKKLKELGAVTENIIPFWFERILISK